MSDPQDRVLNPSSRPEDQFDKSLRPKTLAEMIGQEKIKENLAILIEAAKGRSEPLDHVLFYGPPGLGKTTLAHILANEMGVNIKITAGPAIERQGDLAAILTNLQKGDVFFIDEVHRLPERGVGGHERDLARARIDAEDGSGEAAPAHGVRIHVHHDQVARMVEGLGEGLGGKGAGEQADLAPVAERLQDHARHRPVGPAVQVVPFELEPEVPVVVPPHRGQKIDVVEALENAVHVLVLLLVLVMVEIGQDRQHDEKEVHPAPLDLRLDGTDVSAEVPEVPLAHAPHAARGLQILLVPLHQEPVRDRGAPERGLDPVGDGQEVDIEPVEEGVVVDALDDDVVGLYRDPHVSVA